MFENLGLGLEQKKMTGKRLEDIIQEDLAGQIQVKDELQQDLWMVAVK